MKKKSLLYFGGKIGGIAILVLLSFMLLSGCSCERTNTSAVPGASAVPSGSSGVGDSMADGSAGSSVVPLPSESQGSSIQPGETAPGAQDNGSAGAGSTNTTPALGEPSDSEKAAIMKKYGISEDLYNAYKVSWGNPGGGKEGGMSLDEWIGHMENQRLNPAP